MFLTHSNELSTFAFKLFLNNSLIGTSKMTYKQINKRNDLDLLEELSKEKKQTNFNMSLISM